MSPSELEAIGRELYGERWRNPLAKAIDVHRSAVTHWMNSKNAISRHIEKDIRELHAKSRRRAKKATTDVN